MINVCEKVKYGVWVRDHADKSNNVGTRTDFLLHNLHQVLVFEMM